MPRRPSHDPTDRHTAVVCGILMLVVVIGVYLRLFLH